MQNPRGKLIEDAGEEIPFAKKHLAQATGQHTSTICKENIWPEPDWLTLAESGIDLQRLANQYFYYHSIRLRPREGFVFGISNDEWAQAYQSTLPILRELYESALSEEDFKWQNLKPKLLNRLGITEDQAKKTSKVSIGFWACGLGGSRRISSPFIGTTRLYYLKQFMVKMGWPYNTRMVETSITPCEITYRTGLTEWGVGKVVGNRIEIEKKRFATCEEAVNEAIALADATIDGKNQSTKLIPRRGGVKKDAFREGPDHRNGSDVSPEDIMTTFGLRGIQYGNSVSLKDRQRFLNFAFDSLADMAEIIGFKNQWMGLKGTNTSLGLAVGARGQGGAAAHYEPDLKVINLTYRSGAGCIAHEFAHALDHRLSETCGGKHFLSKRLQLRNRQYEYFGKMTIMEFMDAIEVEKTEKAVQLYSNMDLVVSNLSSNTDYYKSAEIIQSQHRAKKYWTLPEELFARSFEAYIQDAVSLRGWHNPWLVHGTTEHEFIESGSIASAYPMKDERIILNEMMKILLSEIITTKA